jgi:hypothetical protein
MWWPLLHSIIITVSASYLYSSQSLYPCGVLFKKQISYSLITGDCHPNSIWRWCPTLRWDPPPPPKRSISDALARPPPHRNTEFLLWWVLTTLSQVHHYDPQGRVIPQRHDRILVSRLLQSHIGKQLQYWIIHLCMYYIYIKTETQNLVSASL